MSVWFLFTIMYPIGSEGISTDAQVKGVEKRDFPGRTQVLS